PWHRRHPVCMSGSLLCLWLLVMGSLLAGCVPANPAPAVPTLMATAVFPGSTPPGSLHTIALPGTYTPVPHTLMPATPVPAPTLAASPTIPPTPGPSPTPDPYAGLTIDELAQRPYHGSPLQIVETLADLPAFTRSLITYVSDGLTIYGFMNTPKNVPADGALPVVIVLHGYVDPADYAVQDYTTPYADALAAAGYLVLHPNYRNYPPSDSGPNLFRVGYAIDTLNLIAAIKEQAGEPGPLAQADPAAIYLFGHSMGGGIALRVLTVSPDVRAAVLYGAMSGDERQNFERILAWSGGEDGRLELATNDDLLQRISPGSYLDRIQAPVSLHHGLDDGVVPSLWSDQLCEALRSLDKVVECFHYPGQPHNFDATARQRLLRNVRAFFSNN
ncbi:MAG: alpha/beta fold hydrolase, partial [Anaerolineales bacterium]|nr:alpha/beta fold hydrolase [Anaerolineales bacterium]